MKYLGIDFGTKRIGLSVSDESGKLAFPHSVIANDKKLFEILEKVISEEEVSKIILGESKDFEGKPNSIMVEINKFVEDFKKVFSIPIIFEPEFLTSAQAEKNQNKALNRGILSRKKKEGTKNEMLDASAATIILQSFLDRTK